jgi:hypothetical protein
MLLLLAVTAPQPDAAAQDPTRPPAGVAGRAVLDPDDDIAFRAMAIPDTVWVGQQATYQVGVFLSDEIRGRLRRNPVFVPPELRSMLAFDLASTNSPPRYAGQRRYEVHVFQRALFPLTSGIHAIPPARLEYALPLSTSFFAREESHSARTEALVVVARDPPQAGRPSDYRGAVGRLSLQTRYENRPQRTGNPFTLTAVVQGIGNVSLLPRPDLTIGWADVVPGAVRVQLDSTTTLVRGRKEFDWIVTPLRPGRHEVPEARYPYFNPYTERYEVALSPTREVAVTGAVVTVDRGPGDAAPVLLIRRTWRGEAPRPLADHTAYWLVMALAPLPLAGAWLMGRPTRMPAGISPERQLLDAAAAEAADAALVRRLFAGGVAQRTLLSPSDLADRSRFLRAMARAGVPESTAQEALRLLTQLDNAVFGRGAPLGSDAAERAVALLRTIDAEARSRSSIAARGAMRRAGQAMMLVVMLAAAAPMPVALHAALQSSGGDVARQVFADGLQAYDAREYGIARQAFSELAQARPRSADAWANFGTASWQLQDTAAAVVGWQRALRLEPTASDIRELLRLAPGVPGTWHGVAPVSLTVIATLGGLAWVAAFLALAFAARRGRRTAGRGGVALLTLAGLTLIGGIGQQEVLEGRSAAVVLTPARLRELPALSGDAGVEAQSGELVRIMARQGAWTRVRLSDGRPGWLEAQRIEELAVPDNRRSRPAGR